MQALVLITLAVLALHEGANALFNGLALTPQMGWNSWNSFGCHVNESIIITAAKTLKKYHLDKYGYHYIVMDDCWSSYRNASGYIQYDTTKFPRGIKPLADEIHALGLGWGMYGDAGKYTCGGYPGSLGHEQKDAELFASWGVDYLKYDNCFNEGQSGEPIVSYNRFKRMSDALIATGRPILYSMCNWGEDGPWNWATTIANSFRISGDITDNFNRYDDRCPCTSWDCKLAGFHCSVMNIIEKAAPLGQKAMPGAWNDLDSLEVGQAGLTYEEQKLHFTIWAMAKSPLIMGNNLLTMDNQTLEILTNAEVIDLNQGNWSVAIRTLKVTKAQGDYQVWYQSSTDASKPGYIVAVLNSTPENATISVGMADVFVDDTANLLRGGSYAIRDLWSHSSIGRVKGKLTVEVPSHGIRALRLSPVGKDEL